MAEVVQVISQLAAEVRSMGTRLEAVECRSSRSSSVEPESKLDPDAALQKLKDMPNTATDSPEDGLDMSALLQNRLQAQQRTDTGTGPRRRTGREDDDSADGSKSTRLDGFIAPLILQRIREGGHHSINAYVRSIEFRNLRAAHEARRTAQAIDALRKGDLDECLEILVRTLAGLQLVNEHQEPALLEEMEWAPPESVVPRDVLRTLLKDAKRRKNLKPKKPAAAQPNNRAGAGAGGQ